MKVILEIKEMPKCCSECPLVIRTYSSDRPWCMITKKDCEEWNKKRNLNCPLKEIES